MPHQLFGHPLGLRVAVVQLVRILCHVRVFPTPLLSVREYGVGTHIVQRLDLAVARELDDILSAEDVGTVQRLEIIRNYHTLT